MEYFKEIYNLKNDIEHIEHVQRASLDTDYRGGYKVENGLLFGTDEWFKAIEMGTIQKHFITGIISKNYKSGHNDFPEFEITNGDSKTIWTRKGIVNAYKVGREIELVYMEQRYKRPSDITGPISKCIILIRIKF